MKAKIFIFLVVFLSVVMIPSGVQASHDHRVIVFPFENVLDFEIDDDNDQINILVDDDFSLSGDFGRTVFHPNVIFDRHAGTLHFDSVSRHLPPSSRNEILVIPSGFSGRSNVVFTSGDHFVPSSSFFTSFPRSRNRIILSGSPSRFHIPRLSHPSFSLHGFGGGREIVIIDGDNIDDGIIVIQY